MIIIIIIIIITVTCLIGIFKDLNAVTKAKLLLIVN